MEDWSSLDSEGLLFLYFKWYFSAIPIKFACSALIATNLIQVDLRKTSL
jgi:hypothetical protein